LILSFLPKNRRFSPSLLGTLLTLAGVALFMNLGFWQLDRGAQKRALLDQAAAGEKSTVEGTVKSADALPRYQQVRMRGRYDSQHQVLLDNMPSPQGPAGYRVLTPMQLETGGWLLVDRGWIAPGRTREQLPQITVSEAPRTVLGRLDRLPEPGMRLSDAPNLGSGWPRVLNFPTHAHLQRVLQRALPERIVLLDAAQPDGYVRAARPLVRVEPGRHTAYAVQWFAFALLALILYVIGSLRKDRSTHDLPD
jgi:surfeit locus 1 family protein